MKARSAAVQGGLAVAGLVAAYMTWQRPTESTKNESVVIVDSSKSSLERVRYEDGTRFLSVEKKDRLLVTLAYLPGKRPLLDAGDAPGGGTVDGGVDGGGGNGGPARPQPKPVQPMADRTVYGNDRAETLWAKFIPFEATRALGSLPKEKMAELGLTDSERKLEVQVAGLTRRFIISRAQVGLSGSYAQDEKSQEVFLVSPHLFNELDPGSQLLVDRRLHLFKQADFDTFTLKADEKSAAFVQTPGNKPEETKVARISSPDKEEAVAKNWHEKVWNRLIVTEVLGQGEAPPNGPPDVQLRIDYSRKDQPKGWIELAVDSRKALWARSENTMTWVEVHQSASELIAEGQKLLAAP